MTYSKILNLKIMLLLAGMKGIKCGDENQVKVNEEIAGNKVDETALIGIVIGMLVFVAISIFIVMKCRKTG
jgi:hypothetical protein